MKQVLCGPKELFIRELCVWLMCQGAKQLRVSQNCTVLLMETSRGVCTEEAIFLCWKQTAEIIRRSALIRFYLNNCNLHSYHYFSSKLQVLHSHLSSIHVWSVWYSTDGLWAEYHFKERNCLTGFGECRRIIGSWVCLFVPSTWSACDERGGLQA